VITKFSKITKLKAFEIHKKKSGDISSTKHLSYGNLLDPLEPSGLDPCRKS